MPSWSHTPQLVELAAFYEKVRNDPGSVSDADFLAAIGRSFWGTNCWSYVEAAFAIIAPGCAMRPHLTHELIGHPIAAMIAGGLEEPNEVVAQGVACATRADAYVEPTPEGKRWLLEQWPKMDGLAAEVFRKKWDEFLSESSDPIHPR